MSEVREPKEVFGIGAVVTRTGLTAPSIRMWEKRYGAVTPQRNDTNRRLYSREDLERLKLMKQLTDAGHAISRVANLPLDALQSLAADLTSQPAEGVSVQELRDTSRVLVVGAALVEPLEDEDDYEMLPDLPDLETAQEETRLPQADLLVVEAATFFPQTRVQVIELMKRCGACRALVVYRFASERDVCGMVKKSDRIGLLRGPVDPARLRREVYVQLRVMKASTPCCPPLDADTVPQRMFDSSQLAQLMRVNGSENCSCTRHLAELLKSLTAFEAYSESCEDCDTQEAMVHAYLHRTTAHARRSLEEALQYLLKTEKIELD